MPLSVAEEAQYQICREVQPNMTRKQFKSWITPFTPWLPQMTPLATAARRGDERQVEQLLASGDYDVNATDCWGRTPLMNAVHHGHDAIVQRLLGLDGVAVDVKCDQGWTPLSLAASEGNSTIVNMILDARTRRVRFRESQVRHALRCAIEHEHKAIAEELLLRADPDAHPADVRSAVDGGRDGVLEYLRRPFGNIPIGSLLEAEVFHLLYTGDFDAPSVTELVGAEDWPMRMPTELRLVALGFRTRRRLQSRGQEILDFLTSQLLESDIDRAPAPANKAIIQALPTRLICGGDVEVDGKVECGVCLDEITLGDRATVLACSHLFDSPCIGYWLSLHDSCPLCRAACSDTLQGWSSSISAFTL